MKLNFLQVGKVTGVSFLWNLSNTLLFRQGCTLAYNSSSLWDFYTNYLQISLEKMTPYHLWYSHRIQSLPKLSSERTADSSIIVSQNSSHPKDFIHSILGLPSGATYPQLAVRSAPQPTRIHFAGLPPKASLFHIASPALDKDFRDIFIYHILSSYTQF